MEKVKYAGDIVRFRKMVYNITRTYHCVLCNKKINIGDKIYGVFPYNQIFQNTMVHESCINPPPPFDKNNKFVWVAAELHKLWEEAQKYRYWFRD